jgi:sugar lactone lactonase YvrE
MTNRIRVSLLVAAFLVSGAQAGSLYVGDYFTIDKYTPPSPTGTVFTTNGVGDYPAQLAFDASGNLYVADRDNNRIDKYTPSGGFSIFATTIEPTGVAVDSSGNVFAGNDLGNIMKYTPAGAGSTFATGIAPNPTLAFASNGDLFVGDQSGTIYDFSAGGSRSTFATGLNFIGGMAFNHAGDLFVGDWSGNIFEYTPGGQRSTFATGLELPRGMSFDSSGNLFEAEVPSGSSQPGQQHINEFAPNGSKSVFATGLFIPAGLAFAPVSAAPEPGSILLLATGCGLIAAARRRKPRSL